MSRDVLGYTKSCFCSPFLVCVGVTLDTKEGSPHSPSKIKGYGGVPRDSICSTDEVCINMFPLLSETLTQLHDFLFNNC